MGWAHMFGPAANGFADGAMAISAAIKAAVSINQGVVFIPSGRYIIKTGPIIVPEGITLIGGNRQFGTILDARGFGCSVLQLTGTHSTIQNLTVGCDTISDAVILDTNCVEGEVTNCRITGGRHSINNRGIDCVFLDNKVYGAGGVALVYTTGGYWFRNKLDDATSTCTYGMQIDGGSMMFGQWNDLSGPYQYGLAVTNAAQSIDLKSNTYGGALIANIALFNGNGIRISGECNISQSPIGIYTDPSFTGEVDIDGCLIFNCPSGMKHRASGGRLLFRGNRVGGATTAAFYADAGVSDFSVIGNMLGGSFWGANKIGVQIVSGSSDRYRIRDNLLSGAGTAIIDGGTGTNKIVQTDLF